MKTWLDRLTNELPVSGRDHIWALCELSVEQGIAFVRRNSRHLVVNVPDMAMVTCLCGILSAFIDFLQSHGGFGSIGTFW